MQYLRPASWDDAVAMKTEDPVALPIAGGTDLMVEVNFGRERPATMLDLSHLASLRAWNIEDGSVEIGAGVSYAVVLAELSDLVPALAMASRTVGSPQIRNRGTIAGNLATASPAGEAHPPLLATGATVRAESMRGRRDIPILDFFTGVKQNALEPDELIRSVVVPLASGPQQFAKFGTRNAMVIAVVGRPRSRCRSPPRRDGHRLCRPHTHPGRRGPGFPGGRARSRGPLGLEGESGVGVGAAVRRTRHFRGRADRRRAGHCGVSRACSPGARNPNAHVGLGCLSQGGPAC